MQADQATVDEMQDLFNGLQVLRDQLNKNWIDDAKKTLEIVGINFAALINRCRESVPTR